MMIRSNGWRGGSLFPLLLATAMAGCLSSEGGDAADKTAAVQAGPGGPSSTKLAPLRPASKAGAAAAPTVAGLSVVPGQLVVKFKSDDRAGVTHDVQSALAQHRSFASITADASPSLDEHVRRHGIFRATSLLRGREGLSTQDAKGLLRFRASKAATAKGRGNVAPLEDLVNVYRLDMPAAADLESAMADLRDDPHVEYVHPNYIGHVVYTPNDPYWASSGSWGQPRADLWDLKLMHTSQAWDTTRGNGVVVAVVDTGLDMTHPDIAGNIWTNPGEIPGNGIDDDGNGFVDDVHGWNVIGNNNQIDDVIGHGTHVAGTIAAQDNNGLGVVGVAPDAKIMPVHVIDFSSDSFTLSQGLLYAVHNGADVINNSWESCSGNCPSVGVIEDAVRTAHAAGVVVVFAAGNESNNIRAQSPQNMPETIVISATTPGDTRADFSNFGLIDVGAPGSGDPNDPVVEPTFGILGLKAAQCFEPWICNDDRIVADGYVRLAGTSMAAPHAAGLAALILGLHPTYSPEQVRQVMRRTAVDANSNGYDPDLGYGRIDGAKLSTEPTPLEALIQAPLVVRTSQLAVAGRANGPQFQRYVLEYGKGTAPTTWTTIVSSTTQVTGGTLGNWDVSKLADGDYTLRLSAYKTDGTRYEDLHLLALDRVLLASPAANVTLAAGDIAITGIANTGNFKSFTVRVQTFDAGTPVTTNMALTNGGTKPVANGTLAIWHAQNIAAGHYRIILAVTNTDGSVISRNVILIVDPLLHAGWPATLLAATSQFGGPSLPTDAIALADLDGDGKAEVLAGYGERVTVFKGDGTALPGWPQSVVAIPDNPTPSVKGMPITGDVDGDGVKDVVVATWDGAIFVWGSNGALKPGWPRIITVTNPYGTQAASLSLTLGDVDRNGVLDIVATDALGTGVHVFKGNGTYLPGWPASTWKSIKTPATVADLNKDGKNEVIIGVDGSPGQLVVLTSKGAVMPGWPQTILVSSYGNESSGSYPVVGDLDDDGDLEIAAVACDGGGDTSVSKVLVYQHTGQLLTSWSTSAIQAGPLVLADLDGDGSLEVLSSLMMTDGTGGLYAWNRKGTLMPGWPQGNPSTWPMFNAPIVVDLDGDGRNEVVTSRQAESWSDELQMNFGFPVQAYRYDGALIPNLARPSYASWNGLDGGPAVADTDGDGKLELVWTGQRGQGLSPDFPLPQLFAWDLTTPTGNAQPWPMYRADARHSGVAATVVPIQKITTRNLTYQVNGLARFQFTVGSGGQIQIKHPWGAVVQYAVGSNPLKLTTLGWGEQISVTPNQQVLLRVVTTTQIAITLDWW
jgi:subtilisin family serine protease